MPRTGAEKMLDYRRRKREQGLRLVQLWAFDRGSPEFRRAVAARGRAGAGACEHARGQRVPGRAARRAAGRARRRRRVEPAPGRCRAGALAARRALSGGGPPGAGGPERGDRRGRLRQRGGLPDHRLLDPRRRLPGRDRGLVGDRPRAPVRDHGREDRGDPAGAGGADDRAEGGRCARSTGRCCLLLDLV